MPKARTPRMWVTVLASQPSVSIETRDDAADVVAEPSGFADGVHDLAQEVLVGESSRRPGPGSACAVGA